MCLIDTCSLGRRRGGGLGRIGSRLLRAAGLGAVAPDHDDDRADGDDLALGDENLRDGACGRRRDLDRGLVRGDLNERVVLGQFLPLGDEPARDLSLGQRFAQVGQLELVGHGG